MSIEEWIPPISTTALFAFVVWIFRKWIVTRLTAAVAHEYDAKLAKLQAVLNNSEEEFRASLRAKEIELDALRNGALTSITSRQSAVVQRRLQAVEALWSATISYNRYSAAFLFMSGIDASAMAKEVERNPRARELFGKDGLGKNLPDINEMGAGAEGHRPYLSDAAWALYAAYTALLSSAVIKVKMFEKGMDPAPFFNFDGIRRILKEALPETTEIVDVQREAGFPKVAEMLRMRLLTELRLILDGSGESELTVKQSAAVLRLVQEERIRQAEAQASP